MQLSLSSIPLLASLNGRSLKFTHQPSPSNPICDAQSLSFLHILFLLFLTQSALTEIGTKHDLIITCLQDHSPNNLHVISNTTLLIFL